MKMRLRGATAIVIAMALSLTSAEATRASETNAIAAAFGVLAVATLTCVSVVHGYEHPEGTSEFERKGAYLDLAGSYALATFASNLSDALSKESGLPLRVSSDDSLGVSGGAGYRCHRFYSIEVEAEWLSGFDADLSQSGVGNVGTIDIEPLTVTTNFRAHYPAGRWQPFALVGVGIMSAKVGVKDQGGLGLSDSETLTGMAMRFGGGLDFYATKKVVLNVGAEYVLPFADVEDLDYLSFGWGIEYRF